LGLVELFHARHCVAYAACLVTSPEEQDVLLRLGSDDDCVLWMDGKEIYRHVGVRGLHRDQDTVPLTLKKGPQRLLAKVCNREGMWALFVRFTDTEGNPLDNLTFGHP